ALTPPRPGSLTPSPCTTLFRSYPQLWAARDDAVSVGALSLLPGISVTTSAAGSNSPNSPPSRRTRSGAAVAGGARLGDSPANTSVMDMVPPYAVMEDLRQCSSSSSEKGLLR